VPIKIDKKYETNQHVKLKITVNTDGADKSKFMMQVIHSRVMPSNTHTPI